MTMSCVVAGDPLGAEVERSFMDRLYRDELSTSSGRFGGSPAPGNSVVSMVDGTDGAEERPATIAHEAVGLVQRWLAESARTDDGAGSRRDPAAERLAGVLS